MIDIEIALYYNEKRPRAITSIKFSQPIAGRIMNRLNSILNYRCFNYWGLVISLIRIAFLVILLLAKMNIVNEIFEGSNYFFPYLIRIVVCYIVIYILEQLNSLSEVHTKKHRLYIPNKFTDKLYSLPVDIMESQDVQELAEKAALTHEKSLDFGRFINNCLEIPVMVFLVGSLLIMTHTLYIIVLMVLILLITVVNIISYKLTTNFWANYMKNVRRFNYLSDVMTKRDYAHERKAFKFTEFINGKFNTEFDKAIKVNKKNAFVRFRLQSLAESLIICTTVFGLIYFIEPLSLGLISIGIYVVIVECTAIILARLAETSGDFYKVAEYITLANEIYDFLNKPEKEQQEIARCSGENVLMLENIYFSYDGSTDVLKNISVAFKKQRHYGIVGVNGCGKTSLMKIALGIYSPQRGRLMQGKTKPMMIFQDFCQYPISIKEYVLLGNCPNTPESAIFEALEKASVKDDVEKLSQGIDTSLLLLTENGRLLSKGQMQKLTIARAFLSKSEVIILDEPTASLDPIAERDIFTQCRNLLKEKTVIFISHRLGAIRNVDEILVIDNGTLKEAGTHDELMVKQGVYHSLFEEQRSLYD